METPTQRILAEVKGVTLEQDGVVLFPDAPTERGVKHLRELIEASEQGYGAYLFFVIQMEDCRYFTPNRQTHAAFADTLAKAAARGVEVRALNCHVGEDFLSIWSQVEVHL
jgi:sugar fermentation stimulation protein A